MTTSYDYEKEFHFLKKCLEYHNITHRTYKADIKGQIFDDLGLRHTLGLPSQSLENIKTLFQKNMKENTLCHFTDEFCCRYIAILLPNCMPAQLFVVGPYITADEKDHILAFVNNDKIISPWVESLKQYYFKICSLQNEDPLNILVNSFADSIWGEHNYRTHYFSNGLTETLPTLTLNTDPLKHLDVFSNMELIERIYTSENELANAISHGQALNARTIFSNLPLSGFKYEMEPLRNLKNFSIISNTLFRKAAEQGGVHPIYVDQLSTSFLIRIEEMTRSDNVFDLWTDMIQKYCTLVNTHNTRSYSLPVQKVITQINYDITADLSLNTMADILNINASYLSTLFKKETGFTLTNYVNKKRMEHAAFLLSNTALPIATIAQQCGVLDDNYFTKLFKRQYEMTPTQFRESICSDVSIIK